MVGLIRPTKGDGEVAAGVVDSPSLGAQRLALDRAALTQGLQMCRYLVSRCLR